MTILFVLIGMACFLPIFAMYLALFLVLIRLILTYRKPQYVGARLAHGPTLGRHIAVYVGLFLFAQILAVVLHPPDARLGKIVHEWFNILLKHGVVWLVLVLFFRQLAIARGLDLWRIGKMFLGFVVLNLIYVLIQRKTGIDLSHGWSAQLPEHRFAYGIYRASGTFGHPLTLAYTQIFLGVGAMLIAHFYVPSTAHRRTTSLWHAIALLIGLTIFFTGSRWPLLIYLTLAALLYWRILWQQKKVSVVLLVLFAGLILLEGSWWGRIQEVLRSGSLAEGTDQRLVFWQVHWQIFKNYPVFGAGNLYINTIREAYYNGLPVHDKIYTAHNIFLEVLADSGLVGFVSLIALLTGLFQSKTKSNAAPMRGLWLLGVSVILAGLMQDILRDSEVLYSLWVVLAFLEALSFLRFSSGDHAWMKASSKSLTLSGSNGS